MSCSFWQLHCHVLFCLAATLSCLVLSGSYIVMSCSFWQLLCHVYFYFYFPPRRLLHRLVMFFPTTASSCHVLSHIVTRNGSSSLFPSPFPECRAEHSLTCQGKITGRRLNDLFQPFCLQISPQSALASDTGPVPSQFFLPLSPNLLAFD